MTDWIVMIRKNLSLAAATVLSCVVIGYLVSVPANLLAHPDATRFQFQGGSVQTSELKEYDSLRDSIVGFAALTGLFASQTVFLIGHLQLRQSALVARE